MMLPFRTTQFIGYTLVVALMGAFTIYAGLSFISETVVKEAKTRVQMDLNSAWSAYNEEQALLQMTVSVASQHEVLRCALRNEISSDSITSFLNSLMIKHNLDYLTLLDKNGNYIGGSGKLNQERYIDPVTEQALNSNVGSGTILITREELLLKGEDLANQAYLPLVKTERARPSDRIVEDRGMALQTAVPILDRNDQVWGVIYGGILLNRKFDLVDKIREAVFGMEIYGGKPLGTVTIFLWDTRITTNVIKIDSTRAIGTRVSDEVYAKVLEKRERFADRAFVVNDWYLSAYDPIIDPKGNIIGILYVGLLEQKYLDYKSELTREFLGVSFLALLLSVILAFYFSSKIRRPILRLVDATRKISAGKLETRVDCHESTLEMCELAQSFNSMAQSLETRNKQLEEASLELKEAYHKVDEKNRAYLEMLGFVTHELKSPLASIVFAIGSLRDHLLGPLNESQEGVLKSSAKSADYLNSTIANFLNLSRIEEGELKLKLWKVSLRKTIIDPAIQRLSEMASDNEMSVHCNISSNLEVTCDPNLLTSVFQNLISNAIKYGKKGSQIKIEMDKGLDDSLIQLSIFNEGHGFNKEEAKGLFTKFRRFRAENYDTKSGTGLGLFVTKNIIKKHGGDIWAESEEGKWAKFSFTLPKRITQPEVETN